MDITKMMEREMLQSLRQAFHEKGPQKEKLRKNRKRHKDGILENNGEGLE